jgi:hypothetical protein
MAYNVQRLLRGQTLMMKSKVVSQPSVVSDSLAQAVDQNLSERWHFIISEQFLRFPQISCMF